MHHTARRAHRIRNLGMVASTCRKICFRLTVSTHMTRYFHVSRDAITTCHTQIKCLHQPLPVHRQQSLIKQAYELMRGSSEGNLIPRRP